MEKTIDPFLKVKKGMSEEDVNKLVKFKPSRNVGHGIPIDLYELKDGSSVKIGWVSGKVLYVRHGDKVLVE